MRRADKVLLTMGSAMLISSAAALADPPTPYGQYSVNNGTITYSPTTPSGTDATCPSGFTCGAAITGNGFFQRQITQGGVKYFQTITTATDATATSGQLATIDFTDENFVKQGGGTGIADQQQVHAPSTTLNPGDFLSTTAINGGWAKASASQDAINVTQTISDTVNGFDLTFNLADASTNNTAPIVTIDEAVSLYTSTNPNSDPADKQHFYLYQLKGPASPSSVSLPSGAIPTTSLSWAQDEIIQAMWLGQAVTAGTGGVQAFGVQSYSNVTAGTQISYSEQGAIGSNGPPSTASTGPGTWWDTSVFNTAPTF